MSVYSSSSYPSVSVCIIAKDEAETLDRALRSVRRVADEIIVVDTGSRDRTVEVALAQNARVFSHDWQNDFALARNQSLEHAKAEWILVLDADEALDLDSGERLKPLLAETQAAALTLIQRNVTHGGELLKYTDVRQTRLFRNRRTFRYEQRIHEQIRPCIERLGGCIQDCNLIIWHYGYAGSPVEAIERRRRNLALLQQASQAVPQDAYLHFQIGSTYKSLDEPELACSHLTQALELDRGTLTNEVRELAYMKLAQLTYADSHHDEARRHALSSLSLNPTNALSLYVAALSSLELGDIVAAWSFFETIQQRPDVRAEHLQQVSTLMRNLEPFVQNAHAATQAARAPRPDNAFDLSVQVPRLFEIDVEADDRNPIPCVERDIREETST